MTEEQGLLYFGGYIVKRFPQYSFLGQNVTADDATWVGVISRQERKLMIPSDRFFGQLKLMEKCFNAYHGEVTLKPGCNSVRNLSSYISNIVDLPTDIILFYVKCRVFFRIRILNKKILEDAKKRKQKFIKLTQ